jgi:hypothetical protein
MKRDCRKSEIAPITIRNICSAAVICAVFFGITCVSSATDGGYANLTSADSSPDYDDDADSLMNNENSFSDSSTLIQFDNEKLISGIGYGELLLTFTVNKVLPVFSGRYSYDVDGVHIPPISNALRVESARETGYSYNLSNVYIPGKPNDFAVSASGVKTLSIGLRKLQGSYENSSMIWKPTFSRSWVSTQVEADEDGRATTSSDLLSPGIYHAKVFGDAAENASQVNLTMTVVKKLLVNGPYNLSLNTTGFPDGDYSFKIKALNGTFRIDEISIGI